MLRTIHPFKLLSILSLLFLGVGKSLYAQAPESPEIDCITVAPNGNITVNWFQPADPNGFFTGYDLYETNVNLGTTNFIATIPNYNTTSFVVTGYDGNAGSHCFLLVTTYNDGSPQEAPAGEPWCAMHLVANDGLTPGLVQLSWNMPSIIDPMVLGGQFTIFIEYPIGEWSVLTDLPYETGNNSYVYEVNVCEADINFQIRYSNGIGCSSYSNIAGGSYDDEIDPSPPVITSVSVDSLSNDATLNWLPSPQPDLSGYIIYECIPGLNPIPLDTIFDANILTWTNPESQADLGQEFYNIAAFDSCYNADGSPDPGAASLQCVSTIHLTHQWFPCTDDVTLNWTPYNGWDDGVAFYEIYVAEEPNPGSGVFLPSFTLGVVDGNTTTFLHEDCNLGSSYRYRVRAVSNDLVNHASSNRRTATLFYPEEPGFTYITRASVFESDIIEVQVAVGPGAGTVHTFNLERQRQGSGNFDLIDAQELNGAGNLLFLDEVTTTDDRSYTYRIVVENGCGDAVDTTNIGKTILLTGVVNKDRLTNTLFWSHYEDWDNGVERYDIYRSTPEQPVPQLLSSVPGSVDRFEDDVSQLLFEKGEFCYTVQAVENENGYTVPDASESNRLCLTQEPVIWVPNAFVINGDNNTFSPVISFADFDNYRLQVYSRWGDLVFETTAIEEAWDGTFGGELVPEGIFAWFVSITDGAGRIYEERGTVLMLVYPED